MAITTLLVHVEASAAPDPRLELAVDLANQFDAKLIGVGAELYRTPYFGDDMSAAYFVAEEMEAVEVDLKKAEEKFRSAAAAVRQGWDWRVAVRFPLTEVATEARAADLVITSHSRRARASDYNVALPGVLTLQTGRPVLVTPPDAVQLNVKSVVVAWKDTREARRAVSDALPFLERAEKVHLVEICEKDTLSAANTRLTDVAQHLLRHGINSTVSASVNNKDATATHHFLDVAERHDADLIVAGAYGRSRLEEWIFGGFTKALLTQSARAVLFSH